MSGGRIVLLVVGTLLALFGLGMALGGGGLLLLHQTQRDADGYFTTSTERLAAPGYAISSREVDLGADPEDARWAGDLGDLARIRVGARSAIPGRALFVGIGPRDAVEAYLDGVAHSELEDADFDPFRPDYALLPGTRTPAPPSTQGFWVARAQGPGRQTVEWDVRGGRWALVVMNAQPARGVAADVRLGVRVDVLFPVAVGLLVAGLVLLASGVTMVVFGARGRDGDAAAPAGAGPAGALEDGTSRDEGTSETPEPPW